MFIVRNVIVSFLFISLWVTVESQGQEAAPPAARDAAGEAPQGSDSLSGYFFSPELIVQNADRIQLSDEQRTEIESQVTLLKTAIPELQADLKVQIESLAQQIKSNSGDEPAVLAKLEEVLALESEIKRKQVTMLLRVRNQLTPEQQEGIQLVRQELVQQQREAGQRIQQKLQQVQQAVQRLAAQGKPPAAVIQMLQPFNGLIQQGRIAEAEALLDQALQNLVQQP